MLAVKLCIFILLLNCVYRSSATDDAEKLDYVANIEKGGFNIIKPESYYDLIFPTTTKRFNWFDYHETTSEISTTTIEPTTTEKSTTTTEKSDPLQVCSESLHSKNDLEIITEYLVNNSDIFANISNYYYEAAVKNSEIALMEIQQFYKWLENRPGHLEDIFKGFTDTRQVLEPLVQKISVSIEKFQNALELYKEKNNTAEVLFRKFRNSNKICDLNCGKSIIIGRKYILRRSQEYDPKKYYCGSMVDIYDVVTTRLTKYSEALQNEMNSKIINDTEFYNHEIEDMKNNLKDIVLKTFDRTMYEVLNLQDKYHHLSENITTIDIESSINKISQNTAEIYAKLLTFENGIEKFGKFCRNCDSIKFSRAAIPNDLRDETEYDLLSDVIRAKEYKIGTEIKNQYESILKSLNYEITQPYNIELIDKIDEYQKSIDENTEKEKVKYVDLKNRIDQLPLTDLNNVQEESTELLKTVEKHIELIDNFMAKN